MAKSKFKKMTAPTHAQIRAARVSAGLTQTEAAGVCQSSLRTWSNWERGVQQMHPIFWAWFLECAEVTAMVRP